MTLMSGNPNKKEKKPVGRPEKTDSEGNPIITKVVGVNAPIKFLEYLKANGVNRSELFTKVAASYYDKEICNICYGKLEKTKVGAHCPDCSAGYYQSTGELRTIWKSFNDCPNCSESYSHENLFAPTKQGLDGCQICGVME